MRAIGQFNGNVIYTIADGEIVGTLLDTAVSAGFPSPAQDYQEEEIDLVRLFNLQSPTVFIIKVAGDSMREAYVPDRSHIAVDRSLKPRDRHIIVGVLNGDFLIKRLLKTTAGWMLHPENPHYSPYVVKSEDQFEVWGVVTRIFIDPNLYL